MAKERENAFRYLNEAEAVAERDRLSPAAINPSKQPMEMPETPAAFIRENHLLKKNGKIPPARMIPEDTKKRSINSPHNHLIAMVFQQPAIGQNLYG